MNDNNHVLDKDFITFQNGSMNQIDKEKFLAHISSCDYCADLFASLMSEEIIAAPRDMKANILAAAKRPEIRLAVQARQTTKRMRLFLYSLKVGTATVCALLLLLLTMNFSNITASFNLPEHSVSETTVSEQDNKSLTTKMRDKMDNISNNMLDFTNHILNGGN
jgi:hypothetical protein